MTISYQVRGELRGDNSLLVRLDTGQLVERLLFDCGEGAVHGLPLGEVQAIAHLFFSHLHMDHIAGFDPFFRATYCRTSRPNVIWGPAGTAEILQHRFQGFLWNLHHGHEAGSSWFVREVLSDRIEMARFELNESFSIRHPEPSQMRSPDSAVILDAPNYTVEAHEMAHLTPSLAYVVREKPRRSLRRDQLRQLGLHPGRWIQNLKSAPLESGLLVIAGRSYDREELRTRLLVETPGQSVAYLTDFLLDDAARATLLPALRGCSTLVCESQYRHADQELARRHSHMTSVQAAELALLAEVGELVLIHISDRYQAPAVRELLAEAQAILPRTRLPEQWELGAPVA